MEWSPYFKLFKALIADDEIRVYRDRFLWEFVNTNRSVENELTDIYHQYYDQLYMAGLDRRSFHFDFKRLRKEFTVRLGLINK